MKSYTISLVLVFWSLLMCQCVLTTTTVSRSPGNIYLEDGRYKGILIAVDQAVEFNENVLVNLKHYFSKTSEALFEATKHVSSRSFGDITILFPRSWPHIDQCKSLSLENQYAANFIVEKETGLWGSNPHTLKIDSQCGTPAKATYLPDSFVTDEFEAKKYGSEIGKTILHEWGHLRYGLFDELTEEQDPTTCVLFENNIMLPIKCSTDVKGITRMSNDGKQCTFDAHLNQPSDVKASLMYLQYLDTVTTFCNKTGKGISHNSEVPNPQNDRCDGKSAWEVMMEHSDFKQHKVAASSAQNIQFKCVQERDVDRMVLVMDVSGSMQEEHRIQRMQQDVTRFLESLPCRDTSIGMVEFSSDMDNTTKIIHPMAKLSVNENLASLIKAIPEKTIEHTCIGCGIQTAIKLVESSNMTVNGTILAIFTDGQENMKPYIDEVKDQVLSRGIVVYSIMLMSQVSHHPLIRLSSETGGKSCIFSDSQHTTYYDCLSIILHHRSPKTAPNQILSELVTIPKRQKHQGSVIIDDDLKDHVSFVVTWSTKYLAGCEDTIVKVISPDNKTINSMSTRYDYNYNLRRISIDASGFQSGRWAFSFDNTDHSLPCVLRIMVEARQLIDDCSSGVLPKETALPVLIFPTVDSQKVVISEDNNPLDNAVKLYTEVVKGPYAVLDAIVEADIVNENGTHWTVPLYDNGTGADATADDGVYSRYFTGFTEDGTYTTTFHVQGTDESKIQILSSKLKQLGAPKLPKYTVVTNTTYQKIEPFERTQVAGFFEVVNYNNGTKGKTLYPPPKIVDLEVVKTERLLGTITLQWTAVGDILDDGKASHYEIKISDSAVTLRNDFAKSYLFQASDILSGDINKAKDVGDKEQFVISPKSLVFEKNKIYYIAVKTVNSNGLKSPVSNVVMFQFQDPKTLTATIPTKQITSKSSSISANSNTVTSYHKSNESTTASVTDGDEGSSFPVWVYYAIAGLGGGLLLTILILCMVCCSRPSRSSKDDIDQSQAVIGPDGLTTDAVGLAIIENGGSNSDQEPDLIKEINEKDLGNPKYEGQKHSTWPATNTYNKGKKDKKKRANIFRSIGRSHFFSEIRKKLTQGKSTDKSGGREWTSKPGGSAEPMQDHPYSNPLFGHAVMVPEMEVRNSVIEEGSKDRHIKF